MDEGSAPALSIVRGSGPLQPSTILEVKQIPPWAIMLMVPESQERRIQIWPLTLDLKSLGPSWLLIQTLIMIPSEADNQMSTKGPPVRGGERVRMGPSAKDPGRGKPPGLDLPRLMYSELERVSSEKAASSWGSDPKEGVPGRAGNGDNRGHPPTTASALLLPVQPEMCCSHLPPERPGVGLWLWDDPRRPLAQPPFDAQVWLPPALMHFPCSMQGLPSPRLPQATALASTPGWAAARPQPLAWPHP